MEDFGRGFLDGGKRFAKRCFVAVVERDGIRGGVVRLKTNAAAHHMALRIQRELESESARVYIYPICEDDLKDAWKLDQYRCDVDALKEDAERNAKPKLKILSLEKE